MGAVLPRRSLSPCMFLHLYKVPSGTCIHSASKRQLEPWHGKPCTGDAQVLEVSLSGSGQDDQVSRIFFFVYRNKRGSINILSKFVKYGQKGAAIWRYATHESVRTLTPCMLYS